MTLTPEYFEHDMDALRDRADRASLAVGTLQTALRQLIQRWRSEALRFKGLGSPTLWEQGDMLACCAQELEALLPALEPTP